MVPILSAVVPPGTMLRFAPGAQHVMIEGVRRPLPAGDSLALTLYFRRAGSIPVTARVVSTPIWSVRSAPAPMRMPATRGTR